MSRAFTVHVESLMRGTPEQVFATITQRSDAWLWPIEYEPFVGGAERGLTPGGGTVDVWEPGVRFVTRQLGAAGFNEIDYRLTETVGGTWVRCRHRTVLPEADFDVQLDACRQHTLLYQHSLGEVVARFAGRVPAYVSVDAAEAIPGAFARVRDALGLDADAAPGDRARIALPGRDPLEAVVDYAAPAMLGVRTGDALYRVYGRDAWGWPIGLGHHLFAEGADAAAERAVWQRWLDEVLVTEETMA